MNKKFFLRGQSPNSIMLNRPLILGLGILILVILLWIITLAFKTSPQKQSSKLPFDAGNRSNIEISPVINSMPQSYQDTNAIKKILNPTPTIPPEIIAELNDLKSQTSLLQNKLEELKAHSPPPPTAITTVPALDQDTTEARKSNIFPAAGAPANSLFDKPANLLSKNNFQESAITPNTSSTSQNPQSQKQNFLQNEPQNGNVYNSYNMLKPASPYEIQAGTILAANLLTAINTSLPGDVIAQVRQDVYDTVSGKYLLIPKGSKLIGKYDATVAYGQQRVLITYSRIIRPDGTSIQLSNFTGSDQMGESGFKADVDNHWGKILGAATISTLLSFGGGVAADHNNGSNTYYPSAQQGAILGAANNISQTGQALTNRAMNIEPTLTVPAGFNFNVIVNKDMILTPYLGKTL